MSEWSFPTVPANTMPIMYAGSTASLPAQTANPPMAKRKKRRYLASNSETRPPYFLKNRGVRNGSTTKTTMETTTKISVLMVNGEKINPSAITVPRSLMKQAARIAFPYSVTLKPSSNITAYTTATDVVERATPQSQLGMMAQCST